MVLNGKQAEQLLQRAVQRVGRRGITARAPRLWKRAYPALLHRIGICHTWSASTFWGGRFEVVLPEPVSTQVWRYGFFDDDVCLFLVRSLRPGMTFVDIGAHFGFFSLLASALMGSDGHIVALEPMPETFRHLARNAAMHSAHDNITTVRWAAYSARTTLSFHDYGLVNSALNSAFEARCVNRLRLRRDVAVDARTCDDMVRQFALSQVDLIKIDAESAEMEVLRGAEQTIKRFRPRIILEVGDFDIAGTASSSELVRSVLALGYRAYERSHGDVIPHERRAIYEYGNLLFLP